MKLARIGRAAATAAMAAMAAIAFGEALAQEPAKPVRAVAGAAEQINLVMGKGGLYETSAPFAKISVADEKVVDVTPQSDREFVFTPKAIGATNVFVFSDKNKLIAQAGRQCRQPEPSQEASPRDGGQVRIYNDKKSLAKPAHYRCSGVNCELEGEAASAAPPPAATTAPAAMGTAEPAAETPQ